MGLATEQIRDDLDALCLIEPRYIAALAQVGYPEPRSRPKGYATLFRTIVGQQVSAKAADAVWARLEAALGDITNPSAVIASTD